MKNSIAVGIHRPVGGRSYLKTTNRCGGWGREEETKKIINADLELTLFYCLQVYDMPSTGSPSPKRQLIVILLIVNVCTNTLLSVALWTVETTDIFHTNNSVSGKKKWLFSKMLSAGTKTMSTLQSY